LVGLSVEWFKHVHRGYDEPASGGLTADAILQLLLADPRLRSQYIPLFCGQTTVQLQRAEIETGNGS